MVATFLEGIDLVIKLLQDNWNRGNTNGIKPIIIDMADTSPERGKRIDMKKHDYVMVFETAHNEETPELLAALEAMRQTEKRNATERLHSDIRELELKAPDYGVGK